MIVQIDITKIYHGADAAKKLSALVYINNFFDRIISLTVQIPGFKTVIYPTVKLFRNLVLRLSGKNPNIDSNCLEKL